MLRPHSCFTFFFFNDTATTEIYTLSLHDALPISSWPENRASWGDDRFALCHGTSSECKARSEEHTFELQSPDHLVCRLLLEKKKKHTTPSPSMIAIKYTTRRVYRSNSPPAPESIP